MIDIEVARAPGDAPGDDIVDAFIGSVSCAISRGRAELDANATPTTRVTTDVRPAATYRCGQLAEIRDTAQGGAWRGKITSVRYQFQAPEQVRCLLEVERHESA